MRHTRKQKMGDESNDRPVLQDLSRLLQVLLTENSLTQAEISDATGVDQTTISRAKNGKLDRVTDKIKCLKVYADMRQKQRVLPDVVTKEATAFLEAGGSEDELVSSIRYATRLVLKRSLIK